ncbi:MAG: J domain-containing protein [Treponema sp.]|jgi:DnaJ-domain-containing protein 1|nr:J domain-containing protein [Treponema sp.]
MGIWSRLGTVIKSYINDEDRNAFGRNSSRRHMETGRGDPDLDAAHEELDEFLSGSASNRNNTGFGGNSEEKKAEERKKTVPEEIKRDFAELGLTPDATLEECKEAYKKLLKIHHPDRHVKHQGNMEKATEKSTRVNAAYERLVQWYRL